MSSPDANYALVQRETNTDSLTSKATYDVYDRRKSE